MLPPVIVPPDELTVTDPVVVLQEAFFTVTVPDKLLSELVIWKLAVPVHAVAFAAVKVAVKYPAESPVNVAGDAFDTPFRVTVPATFPVRVTEPNELLHVVFAIALTAKVGVALTVKSIAFEASEQVLPSFPAVSVSLTIPVKPVAGVNVGFRAFGLLKVPPRIGAPC